MPRTDYIELGNRERIPILYEDRAAMAIDKPAGWMLIPINWQQTGRNLQAAILSSIAARLYWARSRNLRFLRYVHRLDGETTGILLLAKSQGALQSLADLFEARAVEKRYLAVVAGQPRESAWTCDLPVAQDPRHIGRMMIDRQQGKEAETAFRVLATRLDAAKRPVTLIEARPLTGRTHQIRVHLAAAGCSVIGDILYGPAAGIPIQSSPASVPAPGAIPLPAARARPLAGQRAVRPSRSAAAWERPAFPLGLRSVSLAYLDPFQRRPVRIEAPSQAFLKAFGFGGRPIEPAR